MVVLICGVKRETTFLTFVNNIHDLSQSLIVFVHLGDQVLSIISSSANVNVLKLSMPSLATTCRNIAHCIDSSFVGAQDSSLYSDQHCCQRFHVSLMSPPVRLIGSDGLR